MPIGEGGGDRADPVGQQRDRHPGSGQPGAEGAEIARHHRQALAPGSCDRPRPGAGERELARQSGHRRTRRLVMGGDHADPGAGPRLLGPQRERDSQARERAGVCATCRQRWRGERRGNGVHRPFMRAAEVEAHRCRRVVGRRLRTRERLIQIARRRQGVGAGAGRAEDRELRGDLRGGRAGDRARAGHRLAHEQLRAASHQPQVRAAGAGRHGGGARGRRQPRRGPAHGDQRSEAPGSR